MKVVEGLAELREARESLTKPVGLVPTMGTLHEGHLSLVRRAKSECASVGVSIFVNPAQFGPTEDLDAYPMDLERDLDLLAGEGVDLVWTPTAAEMYDSGYQTWVEVEELAQYLEGEIREGHFRGVATVVTKLFNSFQPDRAYFGQKDAQQSIVIRRMVEDLNFPIEVIVCPTVREADGLAMSSRNSYLSPEERRAAPVLYRALLAASQLFSTGEREADRLRAEMETVLATEPRARPEYASVADPATLEEQHGPIEQALLSMAVFVGKTRLIDNLTVGDK
ncbi:MAG: pantoate--beta-alanine ligase [Chloroflexi bacterium]|nr:pantoate--beta-alanine ligase [Chloroflexota bacterium]